MPYQQLADLVLLGHFAVVLFVVGGMPAVLLGRVAGWRWVDDRRFRVAHLVAVGYIVIQAWLGEVCPLTTLEQTLRERAGAATYQGGFVEHWVGRLLFFDAPLWVFVLAYSLFGLLVAIVWWRFPPRPWRAGRAPDGSPS